MITLKHLRRPGGGRDIWPGLRSGGAWKWHPASLLMLAVLASVLVTLPPAGATDAHTTSQTSPPRPTLDVVVVGDFFSYGYANSADPALRLSVPPTLEALNQIQLANQDVQFHVLFIPVWEATWSRLYKSSGSRKPPLINAVKGANVVIAGVGADVSSFATSLRKILFGIRVPTRIYSPLMRIFKNGSYQREEKAFLEDIAALEARGGAIVTLGYPLVQQVRLPSGQTWWSALSWSATSRQRARSINRLASALDADNAAATKAAGTGYQDAHLLYADPSAMPNGAGARGSQATALKETLIGNTLLPYVTQAVNDELTSIGVSGSQSISPITPGSRWDLSVQTPAGIRVPLPSSSFRPGRRPPTVTRVAPTRRRLTNTQVSPGNKRHRLVMIPVPIIPAPPAPLPKPIAPLVLPKAIGGGGTGSRGASTSPAAPNTNSAPANPGPGGSSPGSGTTSHGGGATPAGSGTTSPGGGTTSSPSGVSPSSGTTSSPSGVWPSGGGSSSLGGGSSSGGGSGGGSGS